MKKETPDYKIRPLKTGLYNIAIERIISCKSANEQIIRFPVVFSKLARSFSIPKKQVWEVLYLMHDMGLIEIVFGHGVKVNLEVMNNEIK